MGNEQDQISARLEYLRGELRAERISYGELAELQSLAPHIPSDDLELREAAGLPESCGQQIYGYGPAEHEYAVTVPEVTADDPVIVIYLSAHGGGTVGEEYAGNGWDYLVTSDGRPVIEGSDLRSAPARAAGHAEMARSLGGFLAAAGESLAYSADRSEYAAEYTAEQAQWLAAEHERLSLFSDPI